MLCYLKGRHPLGCFSSERLEVNLTSAKGFFCFFFFCSNGAQYLTVNDGSYVMKPLDGHRNTCIALLLLLFSSVLLLLLFIIIIIIIVIIIIIIIIIISIIIFIILVVYVYISIH